MNATRRQPDASVLALGWGALWGLTLGMILLASPILAAHHVRFSSLNQRIVVAMCLAAMFAALGAFLLVISGFIVAIVESRLGGFIDRRWVFALGGGVILVAAYTIDSVLIYWFNFRRVEELHERPILAMVLAGCLLAAPGVRWLYRRVAMRSQPLSTRWLAIALLALTAVGAAWSVRGRSMPPSDPTARLVPIQGSVAVPPVLLIGIDGASWRVLQPEIDNGSAPTLRRLIDQGARGTMEALWPPYWSGASWASILTGLPRDTTGVYEDLAGSAPGMPPFQLPLTNSFLLNPIYSLRSLLVGAGLIEPVLPSRSMLGGAPVWEWLHRAGVGTAVVRFRFVYPPEGRASIAVSDRVGYDGWERLGVRRDPVADAVTPASRARELLAPFRQRTPANPALLDQLLPASNRVQPADSLSDPIAALQTAVDIDDRTFEISERILQGEPIQPFMGIYVAGLDAVEHAFWQYRFPEDYKERPPDAADVARLKDVLPRYVRYLDRRLERLLQLYPQPPNVVIVSDHGHGPTTFSTDWRGWHTKDAIVVASGPSMPRTAAPLSISYYDVLPTMLALCGFERPAGLTGRSFVPPPPR